MIAIFATSLTKKASPGICLAQSDRFGRIWPHSEINRAFDRSIPVDAWRTAPLKVVTENGRPENRMAASGVTVTSIVSPAVCRRAAAADHGASFA